MAVQVQAYLHLAYHNRCGEYQREIENLDNKSTWNFSIGGYDHKQKPSSYNVVNYDIKDNSGIVKGGPSVKTPKKYTNCVFECRSDGKITEVSRKNLAQQNHKCQARPCTIL